MKLYVGVTDNDWFRFLAELQPDEVNFWRPGGGGFRVIGPGAPFLFKLHSPHNFIVGGGFFVSYSLLPLSIAWDTFGNKNGAPDLGTFRSRITQYLARRKTTHPDPEIGCIVLVQPFFFSEDEWIPVPEDWSPNIVQGKSYEMEKPAGARLWEQVQLRLSKYSDLFAPSEKERQPLVVAERKEQYGSEYLTRARLGQGAFRVMVTEAYQRRCAITGERTLPVLQAAHIKPYGESGPHRTDNGLLLRADLHILLDRGYLTLADDLRIEVSHRIKEDFENGEHYYALHGGELAALPPRSVDRPSAEFLRWHNENRFRG